MQRRTPRVHVRTRRDAASHAPCTRAPMPRCSVTCSVHTCAHAVMQRHTLHAHVRTCRGAASHLGNVPRCSLTSRQDGPIPFATKSKIVRSSTSAAVGGTGVLDSTSDLY